MTEIIVAQPVTDKFISLKKGTFFIHGPNERIYIKCCRTKLTDNDGELFNTINILSVDNNGELFNAINILSGSLAYVESDEIVKPIRTVKVHL